jgi:tetratricopeptide (TPR) repeat protein
LGNLLNTIGQCEESSKLLVRSVQVFDSLPDAVRADRGAAWHALSAAYYCRHLFSQAERASLEALRLEEGAATAMQVDLLAGLGAIYQKERKYADATAVLERARVLAAGEKSRSTALLLNNLGTLYGFLQRYGEAESSLREALRMLDTMRPEDRSAKAVTLSNLGIATAAQKKYAEAISLFARSVELIDDGAALTPFDVMEILQGYATCLRRNGQKEEAAAVTARAALLQRSQPRQDPGTWSVGVSDLGRRK